MTEGNLENYTLNISNNGFNLGYDYNTNVIRF